MKKDCRAKRVELCKEVHNENGQEVVIRAKVTEEEAQLVFVLDYTAKKLVEVAEFYKAEKEKTSCKKGKEVLEHWASENLDVAMMLLDAADKYAIMCDINGKLADLVAKTK